MWIWWLVRWGNWASLFEIYFAKNGIPSRYEGLFSGLTVDLRRNITTTTALLVGIIDTLLLIPAGYGSTGYKGLSIGISIAKIFSWYALPLA